MEGKRDPLSTANPARGQKDDASTADDPAPEGMEPEYRAAVAVGREQVRRGEIASAEEVEAAFRLFGP